MRLQKYIADAGIASRRKAEELIAAGRVSVNGAVAQLGQSLMDGDAVSIDGKPIHAAEGMVYILLNKPAGVICSAQDQFKRQTVLDLVGDAGARLYPVGRLDYHSTGLVILTNDGDLAYRLTHPKHGHTKTYIARVKLPLSDAALQEFRDGIEIDDYITKPAQIEVMDKTGKQAKIILSEGRNRQIRKMFAALGNEVVSLKRVGMGAVTIDGLDSGKWRHLTNEEVALLAGHQ